MSRYLPMLAFNATVGGLALAAVVVHRLLKRRGGAA